MARRPKIIIGCSTEALRSARQLQRLLGPEVDARLWDEGLFPPGEFTLESLETHAGEYDGAVLVAAADDHVISRGVTLAAPRDNVILEFGLFVARLGRRRTLLLVESPEVKLPSDVAGLTVLRFRPGSRPSASLRAAASRIKELARTWPTEPPGVNVVARLARVLEISLAEVQVRAQIESDLGLHAFVVDWRADPPELTRLARARSDPKASTALRPFRRGSGVVGWCWSMSDAVFVDLTVSPYADATSDSWASVETAEKAGMAFSLLERSRQRYKCIGAVPMPSGARGEFVGCLSYNLGIDSAAHPAVLDTPETRRILNRSAELLALVLDGRTEPT